MQSERPRSCIHVIRPAHQEDLPRCAEIFLETRRRTFTWIDPERFGNDDFGPSTDGERIYVAETSGLVVGFVAAYVPDDFIHHLFVSAEWQGRGIGRALLMTAIACLRRPVTLKCLERNQRACAFYERHGWRRQDDGVDPVLGRYVTYVLGSHEVPR